MDCISSVPPDVWDSNYVTVFVNTIKTIVANIRSGMSHMFMKADGNKIIPLSQELKAGPTLLKLAEN